MRGRVEINAKVGTMPARISVRASQKLEPGSRVTFFRLVAGKRHGPTETGVVRDVRVGILFVDLL